jgi:sec-independent protein translocase protein TatB
MSAPGFWEIVFLGVLALLIFGPQRLPEVARNLGKAVARFKEEASSTVDELKRAAELDEYRDVAGELRSTGADLRRSASLTGPVASPARPRRTLREPARAAGPTPFDPDAP